MAENTPHGDKKQPGLALIRAISDAVFFAAAQTMADCEVGAAHTIKHELHPNGKLTLESQMVCSKLLCSVFSGGKENNSNVKFSKFYLIIDG